MKKIYLILSVFAVVFTACETDFDLNATWEEVTVVYALLDASTDAQYVKINKAFLGNMDALQMAQYADSINFGPNDLDVKIVRIKDNDINETIQLDDTTIIRDGDLFNDTIMIYTFENNNFLKSGSEYELIIKYTASGNRVTSKTRIISNFNFDPVYNSVGTEGYMAYPFGFYNNNEYSSSTIRWDGNNGADGEIYQLDLIIHYSEDNIGGGNLVNKQLVFRQSIKDNDTHLEIEGESFFNFLRVELKKDNTKSRNFTGIDLVMTVGSEDLDTYIKVNQPITSIVQERPYFTNINNGIGLFSSRFTKRGAYYYDLADDTKEFLKSVDGLDRNFQ